MLSVEPLTLDQVERLASRQPGVVAGDVVIGVHCEHLLGPVFAVFPNPERLVAFVTAMTGHAPTEPPPSLSVPEMKRQAVARCTDKFAGCGCDRRFWERYGPGHVVCSDVEGCQLHVGYVSHWSAN